MSVEQKLSRLLRKYCQEKIDDKATEQELLQDDFEEFTNIMSPEKFICMLMNEMCIESLCPDTHEKWEDVCKMLYQNRKNLKGRELPRCIENN